MAKNALIFSPLFFGLLFLVFIAFTSEGGGVRGQSCRPGSGDNFGAMFGCSGCENHCTSLDLPVIYSGMTGSAVKTGQCYAIVKAPDRYVCLCCVAFTSVPYCAQGSYFGAGSQSRCSSCDQFCSSYGLPAGYPNRNPIISSSCSPAPDSGPYVVCHCCAT